VLAVLVAHCAGAGGGAGTSSWLQRDMAVPGEQAAKAIFLKVLFGALLGKGSAKTPHKYFCKKYICRKLSPKKSKNISMSVFFSIVLCYRVFGVFSARRVRKIGGGGGKNFLFNPKNTTGVADLLFFGNSLLYLFLLLLERDTQPKKHGPPTSDLDVYLIKLIHKMSLLKTFWKLLQKERHHTACHFPLIFCCFVVFLGGGGEEGKGEGEGEGEG
jgi:hypothetical protein